MATVGTARMSGGSAARTRAELHYHGEAPTGDGLPAIVVLDPEESVVEVGREELWDTARFACAEAYDQSAPCHASL